jgi:dTDP-4-amino-4,6-dideoxygalactose transaminase
VNEYGVPEPSHVERLITNKTKAIILVHQMGIPCDIDEFEKIKNKYNIPIIEDAACAFGSEYKNKKIGNGDNITVYSFQARKCLTTGEGGMLVVPTNKDPEWFKSMRAFGTNISPLKRDTANFLLKEQFNRIGTNFKISDIQASLGIAHLSYFDE